MDTNTLANTPLFCGITDEDREKLIECLATRKKSFSKDEVIFHAGEKLREMGLVLRGGVNIVVNFYEGSSGIFGHSGKGEIFGENFAAIPGKESFCDAVACEETEVLFFDMKKLLEVCERNHPAHNQLIRNVMRISAQKNLSLSARMIHIAPKSIRERVLSYLSECALQSGKTHFTIPFDRQQLADYLSVDRSALSNELSKMRRDGVIECRKNEFRLL